MEEPFVYVRFRSCVTPLSYQSFLLRDGRSRCPEGRSRQLNVVVGFCWFALGIYEDENTLGTHLELVASVETGTGPDEEEGRSTFFPLPPYAISPT
jgi:hypothetical protein